VRCPDCGGIASHVITDIYGSNYYKCTQGLTSMTALGGIINSCNTVVTASGNKYKGNVEFYDGSHNVKSCEL